MLFAEGIQIDTATLTNILAALAGVTVPGLVNYLRRIKALLLVVVEKSETWEHRITALESAVAGMRREVKQLPDSINMKNGS